jgi:hypothetical protein
MGKARDLARVIVDSGGLIAAGNLGNAVPADGSITNAKIASVAASKLTSQVPDANAPSGSILQVVSVTKVDTFSTSTSNEFVDVTGLTANITPLSSSSKILVIVHVGSFGNNGGSGRTASFRIVRNSTVVGAGTPEGARFGANFRDFIDGDANHARNGSFAHVDSPSTTSSTTYKLQANNQGATLFINRTGSDDNNGLAWGTRCASSITLMEIAA